jgi:hypothetical protein
MPFSFPHMISECRTNVKRPEFVALGGSELVMTHLLDTGWLIRRGEHSFRSDFRPRQLSNNHSAAPFISAAGEIAAS